MANSPVQRFWAALLIAQLASPAIAHEEGDDWFSVDAVTSQPMDAPQANVDDDMPADGDFEQRAAAWRQWLLDREDQRRREGWASDDMPEEPIPVPLPRGRSTPAGKHGPKGLRAQSKGDGRQHHVLGLGHPLQKSAGPSAKPPKPSKPPKAAKAEPARKKPSAKKSR